MRHSHAEPLPTPCATVRSRHLGRGPRFIKEHKTFRIKIKLPVEPLLAGAQDVVAILLGGVRGLFYA
jgi:hypothetical protein